MGITVCLPKHGNGGLCQYLISDKGGHFIGDIGIRYAQFRVLHIFGLDIEVGYGVFQAVLQGAQMGADFVF